MKLTQKQRDHFRSHIKDAVLNNVYDELKYYVYECPTAHDVFTEDELDEVFDTLVQEANLIDLIFVDE